MKLHNDMLSYCLDTGAIIDHNKVYFINHVYQPLSLLSLSEEFVNENLVKDVRHLFEKTAFKNKLKYLKETNDEKYSGFIVPIGNVITNLFKKFKPSSLQVLGGLYEYVIDQISWEVKVTINVKTKRKRSSVDDLKNPEGEVFVRCKNCNECFHESFTLHKTTHNEIENNLRSQSMACLEFFLDEHFNVCNRAEPSPYICKKLDITKMKNIRDLEAIFVQRHLHLTNSNQTAFKHLMLLFLQAHVQSSEILEYFKWHRFRPTRFARQAKFVRRKETLKQIEQDVLGTHEKQLRVLTTEKEKEKIVVRKHRKIVKEWEMFWDDMVFLNNLRQVCFVNRRKCRENEIDDLKDIVSNPDVFNERTDTYFIGYPGPVAAGKKTPRIATMRQRSESFAMKAGGKKAARPSIISQDSENGSVGPDSETENAYDDSDTQDDMTENSDDSVEKNLIRVLDKNWVVQFLDNGFIKDLKKEENNGRRLTLKKETLDKNQRRKEAFALHEGHSHLQVHLSYDLEIQVLERHC